MLLPMRRLLVPVFAVSLTVGGLAYAAGGTTPAEGSAQASDTRETEALETSDALLETEADTSDATEGADPTGSSGVTTTGRSTEGCPEGFTGNHGQFVAGTEDHPRRDAAHSPCGKPLHADHEEEAEGSSADAADTQSDGPGLKKGHDKDEGKGKKDR